MLTLQMSRDGRASSAGLAHSLRGSNKMKFRKKASLYREAQTALNKSLSAFMKIEATEGEYELLSKVISDLQKSQQNSIKARIRFTSET